MKKILLKLFLVLLGIIIALLITEIFIRKFHPQPVFSTIYPYDFHCFTKGSYYWLKLKPNSNCILKNKIGSFEDVNIKTNSIGLRSPEIEPQKEENTLRILFLGDSYTLGWGVSGEESYPRVVESRLQSLYPDKKIEVINAGLAGTGTDYDYLFYKNEQETLQVDVVVVGFFVYNDVAEDLLLSEWEENQDGLPEKARSTFFYVDSDGLFYPKTLSIQYKIPLLRQSHLFIMLANQFLPVDPPYINFESKFIDPHFCLYKEECHSLDQPKLKAKKLFSALKDMTEKNNQKLLVVFIPTEFQIDLTKRIKYIPVPLLPKEKEYPYDYFGSFFKENAIDYLDLRPSLRQHPAEQLYLKYDDHFSPKGHQAAAEAISEKLFEIMNP